MTLLAKLRKAIAAEKRKRRYRAELARLNRHADELNAEQADALRYQADV